MDLPEVEMIGVEALQAVLQQAQRAVAAAIVGLARQERLGAPRLENLAEVVLARPVQRRRVAIVHPEVEGAMDDPHRLPSGGGAALLEPRLSPEGEEGDLMSRAPQRTLRHRRRGRGSVGRPAPRPDRIERRQAEPGAADQADLHELSAVHLLAHGASFGDSADASAQH
jgi:hypothetical protein